MTTPILPPDDELEARLAATFERATQHAGIDLADGRLATDAIDRGRRRARMAPIVRGSLVVAAVAVLGLATLWSVGSRPNPSPDPSAPTAGETPHPSVADQATGSEPPATPGLEGIPYVESFPPTVDGAPVQAVGPAASAAIAAATDDAPFLISGWLAGATPAGCSDFDVGTPAPNGVFFRDCMGVPLASKPGGPEALRVFWDPFNQNNFFPMRASVAEVQQVLLRVHVFDRGCGADPDCKRKPVVDGPVMLGYPTLSPLVVAQTMPPKMIPITTAIGIARPLAAEMLSTGDLVTVRVQAGPTALFADQIPLDQYSGWVYVVTLDTRDGQSYATIFVDAVTGGALYRQSGTGGDGLTFR